MALKYLEFLADGGCNLSDNESKTLTIEVPSIKGKVDSVIISYTLTQNTHSDYANEFDLRVNGGRYDLCDSGNQVISLSNIYWWDFTKPYTLQFECTADSNSYLIVTDLKVTINYAPTCSYGKLNGKWGLLTPYVKVNGTWQLVNENYKINNEWQN